MNGRADVPITTVVDLVRAQVLLRPEAAAVVDARRRLSYSAVWHGAGRVARALHDLGVGAGHVVGLCTDRSVDLVVGMLGVLRAGAGYLPLDVDHPERYLRALIGGTGLRAVVGHRDRVDRLPDTGSLDRVTLDGVDDLDLVAGDPADGIPGPGPGDLCYVLFTSGSTGTPKGVVHRHAALANLVGWQLGDSRCRPGHRTAQFAPTSFDVSFQEVFSTLCGGGTLVCVGERERADPELLWEFIVDREVHRIFLPPVALQLLAGFADPAAVARSLLLEVVTAGEQLRCGRDVRELFAALPHCRLVNQYGPTETHVVTRHALSGPPRTWPELPPIGTPIDHVRLHVIGADGRPVRPGDVGELAVSGVALADGYWADDDLTAQRFVTVGGERVYRTGDLGFRNTDGEFEFLGRIDEQVKVQGYRVEPAQVELALLDLPAVRAAVAAAVEPARLGRVLVAHVVVADGTGQVSEADLKAALRDRLPAYMVPSRIRVVASLPRTRNGKVDRRAVQVAEEATWGRA
ncbi:amino acid adenylation domain-containing protein [Saccharothrix stipae]